MSLIIIILGVLGLITYIIAEIMLLSKGDNWIKRTFDIDSLGEFITMNVVFIVLIFLAYLILGVITILILASSVLIIMALMLLAIWAILYMLYFVKKHLYKIYVANKYIGMKKKKGKK